MLALNIVILNHKMVIKILKVMTPLTLIIRITVLNIKSSVKFKLISEYMLLLNNRDFNFNYCLYTILNEIMLIKDNKS